MVPATSPRGFPLRRDLKGCLEFQAQTCRSARRRQAKSTALKRSVREVSVYSTAGPALGREAAYWRHHLKWHRLKTTRNQNPH
jgi:hypothetical protein